MDYKNIIESRYNREAWQLLLHDIFHNKVNFWRTPSEVRVSSRLAKQALNLGKISLADGESIAIYEVELTDNVDIERNRRGIRDMLTTDWRNMGYAGAFMFCYRQNESVLRFSYVSESWSFNKDGEYKKDSTDTRRFTYLLGEGHRSRTAIQQFEGLRKSNLTLKDLTKAFSVDAVGDMFFADYKQQYEDILAFITGKRMVKKGNKWEEKVVGEPNNEIMSQFAAFSNPEKAVRDYVKKLMGRLVFLQFLQKKGWLGVPKDGNWGDGDREFVQHLFANCDDKDRFIDDVLEPLFNDINTEREGDLVSAAVGIDIRVPYLNGGLFELDAADATEFPLPGKYMRSMLDFFSSYNFTIDENDPDDAEMGVDPEMLGRIFENLLEDNKDKGAFYTPKEIVQYMCRESLIAYLQTDIEKEEQKEAIRLFVTTHQFVEHLPSDIPQLLKDVKICDPAIGSGAFPMGLLKELFLCRSALEGFDPKKSAEIKKHIIQQNIYGVDIEKGAVDIARLRFWLALIVDEESPEALPNLDFKIMQGNSLLECFLGIDLSNLLGPQTVNQVRIIFDDESCAQELLLKSLRDFYSCSDAYQKKALRAKIDTQLRDLLHTRITKPELQDEIDALGSQNDKFFLWHTWFNEVFTKGGFDIVIGNPPYVDSETMTKIMPNLRDIYSKIYKNAKGNWDMFVVFIEFGIKLLKNNGIFCNIIPNKLIAAKYALNLRSYISERNVLEIRDYSRIDVFTNAAVYPITILLRNGVTVSKSLFSIMDDIIKVRQINYIDTHALREGLYWDVFFVDSLAYGIIEKMNKFPRLAEMKVDVVGAATVADAYEIKNFVVEYNTTNDGFKLINSGTIDPYRPLWGIKTCRYIKGSYEKPFIPADRLKTYSSTRYSQALSPKIIVASMSTRYEACLDLTGEYVAGKSTTIIMGKTDLLYYLTAIINSKLASFWLNIVFNSLKMSGGAINIGRNELQLLPVPVPIHDFKLQIDNIITKIDSSIEDHAEDVNTIDQQVYRLYGLTYDEVLIVDPDTSITREEYDNHKMNVK